MLVSEGGLTAQLKKEHKHGYDIILNAGIVVLMGKRWMVELERELVPRKVLGLMVEHMGTLPGEPAALTVQKERDNQEVIWDMAVQNLRTWKQADGAAPGEGIALAWGGAYLYQTTDRTIYGVVQDLVHILETPSRGALFPTGGGRAMWAEEGERVCLEALRPESGLTGERWRALEAVDWTRKDEE